MAHDHDRAPVLFCEPMQRCESESHRLVVPRVDAFAR
jgi:hypothetical protein